MRSVELDGVSWVVVSDLALSLDRRDAAQLARSVDPKHLRKEVVPTSGGPQPMWVVSPEGRTRLETLAEVRNDLLQRSAFLYILIFSTGVVKVGYSRAVKKRIGQHSYAAANFGVGISYQEVLPVSGDPKHHETLLISALMKAGGKLLPNRNEYLSGLTAKDVQRVLMEEGLTQ